MKKADHTQKRILITGADSYVGTSVEKWLARFPGCYQVDTVDMKDHNWHKKDFHGYDTVFHVAGIAHVDVGHVTEHMKEMYDAVNCDLAVETARKAKNEGVRQFIFMSSMIIYGDSAPVGGQKHITASTRPEPSNFYGNSKWKADQRIRALESPEFLVCVLRPPMVYGKGSRGNYQMLTKLAKALPVFPMIQNERSMLYIDNLCEFVRLMIDQEEAGIFFPQNGEYSCTSQLVVMIAQAQGKKLLPSKLLAPAVRIVAHMPGKAGRLANKAFGNFTYDQELSAYEKGDYRVRTLKESIFLTEETKKEKQEDKKHVE